MTMSLIRRAMTSLGEAGRHRRRPPLHELFPRALTREGLVFAQHIREGRFQRSLAAIAAASAVLSGIEVGYQHQRAGFGNPFMYTPLALTPPLVLSGLAVALGSRAGRAMLPAASALTLADGLVGFALHARGVARKPGGWRIPVVNVVMGPPLFAPVLFGVSGYLGLVASFLRREDDPGSRLLPRWARPRAVWRDHLPVRAARGGVSLRHELREGRFQRQMAGAAALAAVLSAFEALYSHHANAFRFRVQWTPVVLGGALGAAGLAATVSREAAHRALPAAALLAAADGALGFAYHLRGILRRPGGARHLVYNVVHGPPPFAPLLLSAAGFLGLLASLLRRERR